MNRVIKYCGLIGFAAIFGLSNVAFAACTFDPDVTSPFSVPDGVSDLSGQGNFTCADFIGSGGVAMTEVTGVVFERDGDWILPESARITENGFVTNTPDQIVLFPQGNGSRCNFSYLRNNAVQGTGLGIGGNVDRNDSVACTDGIVNSEEAPPLPEPDLVTTTDACTVTLDAFLPSGGTVDEGDFTYFTGSNLDGTIQAICSADGTPQNECVRGCPKFRNIEALQDAGYCHANADGSIPLEDTNIPSAFDEYTDDKRCTPCLTAAQAESDPELSGFDTGGLKLCWEYTNSVGNFTYRSHKPVRSQTTETDLFNECYQTTTTVNFFGREITKTITTCD